VGTDELRDLAVIKIGAEGLRPATFGNSDDLEVGEWVLAVGSPFGFDQTVTAGIVSAKGRGLGIISDEYKDAEQFIQTDAAINRGNSGGPLINLEGEVVGINSAIFSPSGGSIGLGFSIPTRLAQAVYANIREGGRADFGYLGVRLRADNGVTVVDHVVDDSPAALAGLRDGDRIVSFQGREVSDVDQLWRAIQFSPPGSEASLRVLRDGKPLELNARIGSLTDAEMATFGGRELRSIGLSVITANDEALGTSDGAEGVYIVEVLPGSAAEDAGLQRGDIIIGVDEQRVRDVDELVARLGTGRGSVRIDVRRGQFRGWTMLRR
jgi:serine protease Do